jgi:hypothetical protein
MQAMSGALLALAAIAAIAAAPVVVAALASLLRRDATRIGGPVALFALGVGVLAVGSLHFAHGWPGTGGRPWAEQHLVPAGLASFAWASTLSISAYWAHPGKLGAFPAAEVAWMLIAPLAIACTAAGAAKTVARLRLSPRLLRFEAVLAGAATIAMLGFLGGASAQALGSDPGPRRLFSSGAIDLLDVAMMALSLVPALAIARRLRLSARSAPASPGG